MRIVYAENFHDRIMKMIRYQMSHIHSRRRNYKLEDNPITVLYIRLKDHRGDLLSDLEKMTSEINNSAPGLKDSVIVTPNKKGYFSISFNIPRLFINHQQLIYIGKVELIGEPDSPYNQAYQLNYTKQDVRSKMNREFA